MARFLKEENDPLNPTLAGLVRPHYSLRIESFEYGVWSVVVNNCTSFTIVIIYRPPYSTKHPVGCSVFIAEFAEFINNIHIDHKNVLVMGDFNIHWDDNLNYDKIAFHDLTTSYGLVQSVNCVTHFSGYTIDLILTKEELPFHLSEPENVFPISDHGLFKFCIDISKPPTVKQVVEYRKLKLIDHLKLKSDLKLLADQLLTQDYIADLVTDFNKGLAELLDRHAPLIHMNMSKKDKPEWLTDDLLSLKRLVRKAEKRWRKSRSDEDKAIFSSLRHEYREKVRHAK
ncbi:hypothetical protein HOLleu_40411 [Holothuria leucospilota]|uniref:Endonuclease/exonuclease/phosphatase domain-containing protein n=1 Tax=Holothuria leucospilota TaxID=206669 RepID=A0A9Q0YDF9_HOLLE|nr:hypothetical protein HOLleu_40411 [Holothuria leucospilota]